MRNRFFITTTLAIGLLIFAAFSASATHIVMVGQTDYGYEIAMTEELSTFFQTNEMDSSLRADVLTVNQDTDLRGELNALVIKALIQARSEGYDTSYMMVGPLMWRLMPAE